MATPVRRSPQGHADPIVASPIDVKIAIGFGGQPRKGVATCRTDLVGAPRPTSQLRGGSWGFAQLGGQAVILLDRDQRSGMHICSL